jgi:hypothetical protein
MLPTHVFAQGGWWIPSRWTPSQALCLVEFVAGIHMSQDTHWSHPSLLLSKASEKIWQVINSNRHYSFAALAGDYCWHRCRVSSPSFFCISITSMAVSSIFLEPDLQFFFKVHGSSYFMHFGDISNKSLPCCRPRTSESSETSEKNCGDIHRRN